MVAYRFGVAFLLYAVFWSSMVQAEVPRRSDALSADIYAPKESLEGRDENDPHGLSSPKMSPQAIPVEFDAGKFLPDPDYRDQPYDAQAQLETYGDKRNLDEPRPVLEMGRPLYTEGPIGPGISFFGDKNRLYPQLLIYGDWRSAVAFNDTGNVETGQMATRLNLDVDLKLTATERIHAFFRPVDSGGQFSRHEFFGNDHNGFAIEGDGNLETLFFEGDMAAIAAGITDEYNSLDIPFAVGFLPLLFQNGVWMEDAFIGGAVTIPAINSPKLDISNMDITFFAGGDKVSSAAIKDAAGKVDDDAADIFGVAAFIEGHGGYIEASYGYTHDTRSGPDFSYHNLTAAYTRRYAGWLSNSVRVIANVGQDPGGQKKTADGFLLLVENSFITSLPLTLIPYGNFWVGIDKPQSLARAAGAGGILKNTGINFETDGLTGFPTLDATANDTFGGALGIEYLFDLSKQIVVEFTTVQVIGGENVAGRAAKGDQYALGLRYQHNLNDRWILRADAMQGWRRAVQNVAGMRLEIRRKF